MKYLVTYTEFNQIYSSIVYAENISSALKILMDDLGLITVHSIYEYENTNTEK